ncbi:MAG: choice-of-anchor J domain-containing protein [Bacteroidales bacterium]|nr:choice-of-anchor J domain-containing protein [Bacteroidales bacterium]
MKKLFTLLVVCFAAFAVNAQITDDFESYANFTVNPASPWTFVDVDGAGTYGFQGISFENSGSPMAFIVMNFDESVIGAQMSVGAHSGSKFLACFAATTPPNDDWIISPELTGAAGTITFYALTYTANYGLERMRVLTSSTTNDVSSFSPISEGAYVSVPDGEWTEYTYNYPAGTKYVAINCVSNDAFIFMLDDITISTGVGIEDVEAPEFTIYPNPATDILTVNGEGLAEVYNTLGQMVISENVNGNAQLNVSNLESGVYFVRMNGATQRFIKK